MNAPIRMLKLWTRGDQVGWSLRSPIVKVAADMQKVFGWAYTSIDKLGRMTPDWGDDVIFPVELEKAAHNFALKSRAMGVMHETIGPGRMIESVFVDAQKLKAMDLPPGALVAWWVGFQVDERSAWQKVLDGMLAEFSIGGTAFRRPVPEVAPNAFGLFDIELDEVSLVDKGEGRGVRVTMFKRRADDAPEVDGVLIDIIKLLATSADPVAKAAGVALEKAKPTTIDDVAALAKSDLAKAALVKVRTVAEVKKQGLTLNDIKAKLTVEEWEVLMQALAQAGAPGEGAPAEPAKEGDKPAGPPMMPGPPGAGGEMDETQKLKKQLEASEAERKAAAERIEKLEKAQKELTEKQRLTTAIAKAEKEFPLVAGTAESIAKRIILADDLRAQGSAEMADDIMKSLARENELAKASGLLQPGGSVRKGDDKSPLHKLREERQKVRDANTGLSNIEVMKRAVERNPDAYREYYTERRIAGGATYD